MFLSFFSKQNEYILIDSNLDQGRTWPKVSVIIVNWNGERFIERCLKALSSQSVPPHQIIVLDNASTDNSLKIINKFKNINIIASNENTGFAKGNNIAMKYVSIDTKWIALLNPDAFPDTQWLEELLKSTQKNTTFDVFGSQLVNANNRHVLDGVGDAYHISGLVWREMNGESTLSANEIEYEIFSPCAAAALYKREALLKADGFDEDFFCYVEDIDLGFRLRLFGYKCLYVPKSIAFHIGSATTGGKQSKLAMYYGHRNLVWAFFKNMPGYLFWTLLPLHLILNAVSILWFSFNGNGKLVFQAKFEAFLGIKAMLKKRKIIQRNRTTPTKEIWAVLNKKLWRKKLR